MNSEHMTKYLPVKKRLEIEKIACTHPRLKPFVHDKHENTPYELFKRWIFPGPIGFAFRFVVVVVFYFIHYLVQRIIFISYKDWNKPAKFRRKLSSWTIRILARILLFFAGFHWIEFVDHTKHRPVSKNAEEKPRYQWDQPWVNITPHATAFDIISEGCYLGAPSFAAKDELRNILTLRFLLKAFRCMIIYRSKEEMAKDGVHVSNFETVQQRVCRPAEGEYAPLIFAEGTTNNSTCLVRFHTGAFLGGQPVRPIVAVYPHTRKSLSWDSTPFLELLYDMLTQFNNRFRIEICDLYLPSAEEKADAQLYADNVGRMLAEKMGVPYVTTVGLPEKLVLHALLMGQLGWEGVEAELQRIDADREREADRRKKMKDAVGVAVAPGEGTNAVIDRNKVSVD